MPVVSKARKHLVNFRVTAEEFASLKQACEEHGARSVSDFVREAVIRSVNSPSAGGEDLGRSIERLTSLLLQFRQTQERTTAPSEDNS